MGFISWLNEDDTSSKPIKEEKSKAKEKKKHKWKDNREDDKFVCQGAKVKCKYCSNPTTSLVVSNSLCLLQENRWATTGDNNGAVNTPFDGVCKAYPSTNKPPCTSVINLMGWEKPSFTSIDDWFALRKDSTNKCSISNDSLTIEHSGQYAELVNVPFEIPNIEIEIISIETEYFSPLGIQNPLKPKPKTEGKIRIKYKISKQKATSLSFSVFSKDDELIGFDSLVLLNEVEVTGKKTGNKPDKKPTHGFLLENRMLEEENLEMGTHIIEWDGFDPSDILDTSKFAQQITFQIRVSPKTGASAWYRKIVITEPIVPDVKWVMARVDKGIDPISGSPKNKIDVLFNINLKDGGEKGLSCQTIHKYVGGIPSDRGSGIYKEENVCDWDKIPKEDRARIKLEPIKTRTRSFDDLVDLVKKGVNKHWSRNKETGDIGRGINVDTGNYKVRVNAKNTDLKPPYALDDIPLIFNTNRDWGRSGNPGCVCGWISRTTKIFDAIGDLFDTPIQQITYNVGYIKHSNWRYDNDEYADDDFKHTSAHELGHGILQAFGGDVYSYQHKGSSYIFPQDTKPKEKLWYNFMRDFMPGTPGEDYPGEGEQDLMKYYNNGIFSFTRNVAHEDDVKGLLWLTGIKLMK